MKYDIYVSVRFCLRIWIYDHLLYGFMKISEGNQRREEC